MVPSVSTSAIPADKTGNPKERSSCFKKGGTPLAQVITILLFLVQKDITAFGGSYPNIFETHQQNLLPFDEGGKRRGWIKTISPSPSPC
jgi:hypothetical protein